MRTCCLLRALASYVTAEAVQGSDLVVIMRCAAICQVPQAERLLDVPALFQALALPDRLLGDPQLHSCLGRRQVTPGSCSCLPAGAAGGV
jgi:hypothetical protein